jgi:hypothetical protein
LCFSITEGLRNRLGKVEFVVETGRAEAAATKASAAIFSSLPPNETTGLPKGETGLSWLDRLMELLPER